MSFAQESANVVIRLTTAALTTFSCIILLYAFDSIAHSFHAQGKHSWVAAVSNILRALGITIGFAWERAFGEAKRAIEIRCGASGQRGLAVAVRQHAKAIGEGRLDCADLAPRQDR